ncbi:MAG: hypothetical protein EAZ65_07050 [Verrucomicrobia bacterium]|nr:MAG: hypothetical protein EAZ84_09615 [Verrucomicrobiota bacterium]TAE87363.1 MAG: hypothetical protein EAZ82_08030 [Verrucomicrobiota bacterium]TAF25218.1 MAG: hypothetical protein EAZ71_08255 [Verrucomicrobiota bacterium]TAF40864.1 MAG: hypothetical protein EAZ65_07050 [Verrucomicrobiota bacterium]
MEKKILFLAYYFPPLGGAGSQRSLKFVKYLPAHGFRPLVFSGAKGGNDRWAPLDEELAREIGAATPVRRVNLYERPLGGRLLRATRELLGLRGQFGARWLAQVRGAGRKWCREHRPDLIFATMSPFDTAPGAAELAAEFGIPWVADLRDPWALDEWQIYPTRWHRMRVRREMERSLRSAALIIMNTPEAAARCRKEFPSLAGVPIIDLTNGYDAEDFAPEIRPSEHDEFTIVHAGAMHTAAGLRQRRESGRYRVLGRATEGVRLLPRSHFYLLQAVERWLAEDPSIAKKIRLEFVGVPTAEDRALVDTSPVAAFTTFTGYLKHSESVRRVRNADLLFFPMHALPPGRRATIVPGKAYEYIASGRPVLAAVPEGDARDYLRQAGNATLCGPEDVDGMLAGLKARFAAWSAGEKPVPPDTEFCRRFERATLTARLAGHLNDLLK